MSGVWPLWMLLKPTSSSISIANNKVKGSWESLWRAAGSPRPRKGIRPCSWDTRAEDTVGAMGRDPFPLATEKHPGCPVTFSHKLVHVRGLLRLLLHQVLNLLHEVAYFFRDAGCRLTLHPAENAEAVSSAGRSTARPWNGTNCQPGWCGWGEEFPCRCGKESQLQKPNSEL